MVPLIGVPCCTHDPAGVPPGYRVNQPYSHAVEYAGGAPTLLPLLEDENLLRKLYQRLDGLLLTGGPDVHPHRYGEEPHPKLGELDYDMDQVELLLLKWAMADDLPILAICRGLQVLNVAAGGTLYQDIPSQIPWALDHRRSRHEHDLLAHSVTLEPDSKASAILSSTMLEVNTSHHQAVKAVAPGLVVTGRSPDGVIEGIESTKHRFLVAVQWHPEELFAKYEPQACLFRVLVHQASRT